ncbi:MAG TPA: hypothetical protein P5572_22300 [Phycisphaerae bacterium]|nr:hypothetical protein [Phycisphaerae bacterium]
MTHTEHAAPSIRYGDHSPFDAQERATIAEIHDRVCLSGHPEADQFADEMRRKIQCLDQLGDVIEHYPSPRATQTLGSRSRGLQTLVDTLSRANPADFEFLIPTRAVIGRALVMAESNFYRFLRHVCEEALSGAESETLREQAAERMHHCLYTKLVEEVLAGIACDGEMSHDMRSRAVTGLAQVWEHRLTYRVRDFFPVLEATWSARQKVTAVGGTLSGMHEIFALFQAGCDPRFVDCFARPDPDADEIEAFREFLFGASTEELERLSADMAAADISSVSIRDRAVTGGQDPVTVFYSFFRMRHLQAVARRFGKLPGPKRTAEAYVLMSYLMQKG